MTGHACIVKALRILDGRANAGGLKPGLNAGSTATDALLTGTDLVADEIERAANALARDFLGNTLVPLIERDPDGIDAGDLIGALAQFYAHGVTLGGIAVAEADK